MYKSNKMKQSGKESSSVLFWLMLSGVVLFLFWAPFQKALFNGNNFDFERDIYSSLLWCFIGLFLLSIYLFYKWELTSHQDLLTLLIWLMPLTFLVSKISAASQYYATNMFYIESLYATAFLLGLYLTKNKLGNRIITYAILSAGYVVVWFGLLNWFGYKEFSAKLIQWFVQFPNKLEYQDAVMLAEGQLRLTSTFQYANSYAAFLIALLLGAVYLIVYSNKWYSKVLHSFMLVPIIISFLLTLSRGGLVILPIILLFILPFIKLPRQIIYLLHLIIAGVLSFFILGNVTDIGQQVHIQHNPSNVSKGIWLLVGISLLCSIVISALQQFLFPFFNRWMENKVKIRFANVLLPGSALILGSLGFYLLFGSSSFVNMLPDYIKQRIENINFAQHSVLERETFYKDSMKLFKDYPIIGAGGGAWAALYEKYQNNPYVSRQTHNFFIQYLLESGILGLFILCGLLIYIFILYFRQFKLSPNFDESGKHLYYILVTSILIHSVIDFDMSYVFLGSLVFISLGAMISGNPILVKWTALNNYKLKWVYPSLLLIVSLLMFINSSKMLVANSQFNQAVAAAQNQKNMNEIFTPLNKALEQHQNHPDYAGFKIDILLQAFNQSKDEKFYKEATTLIQQTLQMEPHNRLLIEKEIYSLAIKDQLPKALEITNEEINNFPWDITLYEKSISISTELGNRARLNKNDQAKNQYWTQAFETYDKILVKAKELESLPKEQHQGRAFGLTKTIGLALGQIDYMLGKYNSAESFLNIGINDTLDDPLNRQLVRWYLAAVQKQGKNDQALYDKLIAKDSNEFQELQRLVFGTF